MPHDLQAIKTLSILLIVLLTIVMTLAATGFFYAGIEEQESDKDGTNDQRIK